MFVDGKWIKRSAPSHPSVNLMGYTDQQDYDHFRFSNPKVRNICIDAVVDSGAQCCVWSWRECKAAGFKREDLIPVKQKLNAVSKDSIRIYGEIILRMHGTSLADLEEPSAGIVYVSPDVTGFYLSNDVMKQLSIVPKNFPLIGGAMDIGAFHETDEEPCNCPSRSPPPGLPTQLPFDPIPENIHKMKDYLLNRYASSTFNKCPHHPIPAIPGPPMSIHVDPDATPISCSIPSQVPLHYLQKVEEGLKQDEAMGII